MAYTEAGGDTTSLHGLGTGYTWINHYIPGGGSAAVISRGVLKLVQIRVYAASDFKFKVFRDDGTNYLYVGGTGLISLGVGLQVDVPVFIPGVEVGDLLGFYFDTIYAPYYQASSGSNVPMYHSGDVVSDTLKSSWASVGHGFALKGKIFTRVGVL